MRYAKAIVGALIAGLSSLATALDDAALSAQEVIIALVAVLVGLSVIWAVPNATSNEE